MPCDVDTFKKVITGARMKIMDMLITLLILISFSTGALAQTLEERVGALDEQRKLVAAVDVAPSMVNEIRGSVKDALERPLAGANLTLRTPDNKIVVKTRSDSDGNFVITKIAPGRYMLWAEKEGFNKSSTTVTVVSGTGGSVMLVLTSEQALETSVIAEQMIRARSGLSPTTGGSVYHFDQDDIHNLPEGANTTFNQLILQAPGVVNDSYKQFHIRGDEGNVQYRINGIMLPEGITTGFGPIFDTRFFNRVDLLTGGLPAQFGFHTAGVVDIETKAGEQQGGRVEVYGGSHDTVKPSSRGWWLKRRRDLLYDGFFPFGRSWNRKPHLQVQCNT